MKKFILTVFSIILGCNAAVLAQKYELGIRAGLSIPNLTAGGGNQTPLSKGYGSRLGPDLALLAEFEFSRSFSLQPMFEYSSQGGKKKGLQAFTTPQELVAMFPAGQAPPYLYANYKSEAKLNYLMLPVLAKFGKDFKNAAWRIYADAGPFVALLVSAHQVTGGQSQFYLDAAGTQPLPGGAQSFDHTENIKSDLRRFNVGLEGNIGLSYKNVFIEGGGNYGFINIQKNALDGKNNTGAAVITIGYNYFIGK